MLQNAFNVYEKNGVLPSEDLGPALRNVGISVSTELSSFLAKRYGVGNDFHIEFEDFMACIVRTYCLRGKLRFRVG